MHESILEIPCNNTVIKRMINSLNLLTTTTKNTQRILIINNLPLS